MKGLVEEGQEVMAEDMSDALMDCALVGAARRVEHYEMAGYDSARGMAQALGLKDAMQLLQETLNEETQTDKRLTQIGKRLLKEAGRPQAEEVSQGKAQAKSSGGSKKAASKGGAKGGGSKAGGSGQPTTDHDEIKRPRSAALIYQEKTAEGQKSNFNKLVKRETVQSGKSRSGGKR